MALNVGKSSIRALLMRGWNEIPEVMASSALGLFGIVGCVYGCWRFYANDGNNKKYKNSYIVYRPEDPRCAKVHRD